MRMLPVLLIATLPAVVLAQAETPSPPPKKPDKGQVYKYVDEKGVVHYTDQPPSDNARPAQLPPLQTYRGGSPPDLSRIGKAPAPAGAAAPAAAPDGMQIQIVTPSAEETFRGAQRVVPVAVLVTPALGEGQRLIYLLDGTPRSLPTTDTSYSFTEVDRGSHTAAAAIIDAGGNELARSPTVTFHMKPPIAR